MMVFQKIMFIETNLAARNKQQIAFVQLQENKILKKTSIFAYNNSTGVTSAYHSFGNDSID